PFSAVHLDDAARLLSARVQRDCACEPHLNARFADPAAARMHLHDRLETADAGGVVALHRGNLAGYLLAGYAPARMGFPQRRVVIRYHDYAAYDEDGDDLLRALYAALSPTWLARGHFGHLVQTPVADRETRDAWISLGFGQEFVACRRAIVPI